MPFDFPISLTSCQRPQTIKEPQEVLTEKAKHMMRRGNLNEPRTALRKHKVGDWKGQARGTVPMRPAADMEAPEASAQPFPDTTGPLIPEGAQKPPVRCNHDEEVLPEHCACRRRLCSQAVRFLLWCAHDGQFHLSPCAGGCGAIPCVGRQGSDPNAEWMSK